MQLVNPELIRVDGKTRWYAYPAKTLGSGTTAIRIRRESYTWDDTYDVRIKSDGSTTVVHAYRASYGILDGPTGPVDLRTMRTVLEVARTAISAS